MEEITASIWQLGRRDNQVRSCREAQYCDCQQCYAPYFTVPMDKIIAEKQNGIGKIMIHTP